MLEILKYFKIAQSIDGFLMTVDSLDNNEVNDQVTVLYKIVV